MAVLYCSLPLNRHNNPYFYDLYQFLFPVLSPVIRIFPKQFTGLKGIFLFCLTNFVYSFYFVFNNLHQYINIILNFIMLSSCSLLFIVKSIEFDGIVLWYLTILSLSKRGSRPPTLQIQFRGLRPGKTKITPERRTENLSTEGRHRSVPSLSLIFLCRSHSHSLGCKETREENIPVIRYPSPGIEIME